MLILVRHGRTAPNASGVLLGRSDPPLDSEGRRQARAVVEALRPDIVITSPLRRCRDVAEGWGLPYRVDDRFVELDYGSWEGLRPDELPPGSWDRWRNDPDFRPPGGESLADLQRRVVEACTELAAEAAGAEVVVVSHVSPIKAVVTWALGVPATVAFAMWIAPASVTRVRTSPTRALVSFNDRCHLGPPGGV